jgi:hypothetical protein
MMILNGKETHSNTDLPTRNDGIDQLTSDFMKKLDISESSDEVQRPKAFDFNCNRFLERMNSPCVSELERKRKAHS